MLKRPNSLYRSGRHSTWREFKARHTVDGMLLGYHRDRDGQVRAVCDVDGRRVIAHSRHGEIATPGEVVMLAYSRVDANGSLREVRVDPAAAGRADVYRGRVGLIRDRGSSAIALTGEIGDSIVF